MWGDKGNGGGLNKFLRVNGKRYKRRDSGKDKHDQIRNAEIGIYNIKFEQMYVIEIL